MVTASKVIKQGKAGVKKAGRAIGKAVDAVVDTFENPPLAINKVPKKAAGPASKTMDRKLVSTMETYEVQYLARKHGVTQKAVKQAVAKVGHSRAKVERELKAGKTR